MIYKGIKALLDTATGLDAYADDRIYPVIAPQGAAFPYVTYEIPSVIHPMHLRGGSGLGRATVEVSCWAEDPGGFVMARDMKETVRLRLTNFIGTIGGIQIRGITADNADGVTEQMAFVPPQDDSETGVHVVTLTFLASYVEANPGE